MSGSQFGKRPILKIASGALALAALLGLTGCSPESRIAARIVDSQLVFALCEPIVAQQVQVLVRAPGNDEAEPPTYWRVTGNGSFEASDQVTYGVSPEGFDEVTEPTSLPTDESRILFYVDRLDSNGDFLSGVSANLVAEDLSEDYWLHEGGSRTDEPCD